MLSHYQALTDSLVSDDAAKIDVVDRDNAIAASVLRYSKDRPREKVEDLTPANAQSLPLPAAWADDFSDLRSLEHPIGSVPPNLIEPDRYAFYRAPSGLTIMLLDAVTVAAGSVRATYTIAHALSTTEDTIPPADREPVCCWAAALLCEQLASLYSANTDSTIQADHVETMSKAQQYAKRARDLRKRYLDELGVEEKRAEASGVVVNMDFAASDGEDRLTHRRRFR